jgi:hypothetical protein
MAWQTPKLDWTRQDGVREYDLNRIEGNILELYNTDALRADRVIYVSASTGSDASGNGSASAPYASITKALNSVPHNFNGKSIIISIDDGVYREAVTVSGFSSPITFAGGSEITVNSLRVEGCVLMARDLVISTAGSVYITDNASFIGDISVIITGSYLTLNYGSMAMLGTITCNNSPGFSIAVDRCSRLFATYITGVGNDSGISCQAGSLVTFDRCDIGVYNLDYFTAMGGRMYSGGQAAFPSY